MSLEGKLKEKLLKSKIKTKELAQRLNISVSYLYYILEGKRKAYEIRKKIEEILKDK